MQIMRKLGLYCRDFMVVLAIPGALIRLKREMATKHAIGNNPKRPDINFIGDDSIFFAANKFG
jgi:hypothetical protein